MSNQGSDKDYESRQEAGSVVSEIIGVIRELLVYIQRCIF